MPYPADPLTVEVGLHLAGAWVNATTTGNGVLVRDGVTISAGRGNWAGTADPSRASFSLRNVDGRWSPDNVGSANFGSYKRNIPTRVGVGVGATYLTPTGVGADVISTPNVAAINLTGDLDLRIEIQCAADAIDIVEGGKSFRLMHKSSGTNGYQMGIYNALGKMVCILAWNNSVGTGFAVTSEQTGAAMPWSIQHDRVAIRATLDVDNGAAGHTVTFYTAPTIAGPWVAVGAPVVVAGTTNVGATTAPLRVGGNPADLDYIPLPGRINAFELRNGIGGTVVANPTFTTHTVDAASFTDGTGKVWTVGAGGRITNIRWRFHGELASLPVRWDLSGNDVWAPVEATGLLRRLRQGPQPLDSPLRRAITRTATNLVGYWPMEDTTANVTQFGPAVGTAPMVVIYGSGPPAANDRPFVASGALPTLRDDSWAVWPDSYPTSTSWQVRWLMSMPDDITGTDIPIIRVQTSDLDWRIRWSTAGTLQVIAYRAGVLVYTGGVVSFEATGRAMRYHFAVSTSGANVSFELMSQPADGTLGGGVAVTNALAGVPGLVQIVQFNNDRHAFGGTQIGHVTVQSTVTPTEEVLAGLNGYRGETAGRRIIRLCGEEGVAVRLIGDPDDTEPMGPQAADALPQLLQDAADVDGGSLHEARDSIAVAYRTRVSMQAQVATYAATYSAGHLAGTIELDRDDQGFSNDVTVKTTADGNPGRAILDDGSALSISQPPTGAGRYASSFDLNALPNRAVDIAGDRLRLSTVNEPRVSRLVIATNLPALVASPTLTDAALELGIGDLITVAGLPSAALGTGTLRQIVQGTRESIQPFDHRIDLLTTPGSPWDVRTFDVDARYDTAGSSLSATATVGATSMSVATTLGPLWTTNVADLPFDVEVGGVRVTVTAISGASSPQTFTVAALPRTLTSGTSVRLADPTYYEL